MIGVKVLIIDGDPEYYQKEVQLFRQAHAIVEVDNSGQNGLKRFYEWRPDLVILDISITQSDGWELCSLLCGISDTPVIVISSIRDDDMAVRAMQMGAGDFLVKPFRPHILLVRSQAVLRRTNHKHERQHSWTFQDSHISIDLDRRRVFADGEQVHLTKTEYRLLVYLLHNAGQVLSTNRILENVWGPGYNNRTASVYVYISRLRHKLERDPRQPRYLHTEHGIGYWFDTRKNVNAHLNGNGQKV